MRAAITYYLIFALAAGPAAFCCCTLKAIAAPSFTAVAGTAASAQAPNDGGCPHCTKPRNEPPASPQQSPPSEKEQRDRCPCKNHSLTVLPPDTLADHARGWLPDPVASSAAVPELLGILTSDSAETRPEVAVGQRDGPWLSAHDLLSAHHVIRC